MKPIPNHCGRTLCPAAGRLEWTGDGFQRRMQPLRAAMRKISPAERQARQEAAALSAAAHEAEHRQERAEARARQLAARAAAFVPTGPEITLIDMMPCSEIVKHLHSPKNKKKDTAEARQWRAERVQDLENWKAHRGQAAVAAAAGDVEKGA